MLKEDLSTAEIHMHQTTECLDSTAIKLRNICLEFGKKKLLWHNDEKKVVLFSRL